jgi:hypothetical protein
MKVALVRTADNLVTNVCVMEEGAKWAPPDGHEAIPSETAGPGDYYDFVAKTFTRPAPIPSPFYTSEELESLVDSVSSLAEAKVVLKMILRFLAGRLER